MSSTSQRKGIGTTHKKKPKPTWFGPLPQELDTIAGALNRLLERIRIMRVREKRFIADAAHELRTPLAVLDLHAQNALIADNLEDYGVKRAVLTGLAANEKVIVNGLQKVRPGATDRKSVV